MRRSIRFSLLVASLMTALPGTPGLAGVGRQGKPPTLDQVVARISRYVAGYGEHASLIVGVERYDQKAATRSGTSGKRLTSEFAIVRAEGSVGWIGFRDIVEVDGKKVTDRTDRLRQIFMGSSFNPSAVLAISDESARFNVGPVMRNFNVPTTALFFFHPANVGRFNLTDKGTTRIGSAEAREIAFVETHRPTLLMKRDGTDVPSEGTVWVSPDDGTVLRTHLRVRHFADRRVIPEQVLEPATQPATGKPLPRAQYSTPRWVDLQSLADIDVTYDRDARLGLWLPSRMTEAYEIADLSDRTNPSLARITSEARYSEFRQFQTSAKITFPK